MAIFGKDRERRGPEDLTPPAGDASREAAMFEQKRVDGAQASGASAFLGKGTRVNGKLTFEGPVRIEGLVEGEISAQDTLTIGEGADVRAQVSGTSIVIHGNVTGDVKASKRLEIRAPAKLLGNITSPVLVIHEGVIFEGQCSMGAVQPVRADRDSKVTQLPTEKAEASK